ncbi:hypothetical protein Tco_0894234 [Tanacetum coccineum]|uniref:Uncharacterized protein n=1 Tax=Tanacetum coccineum TaxID=301880 RepID=A0ABQ5CDP9_9ASTR
MVSRPRGFNLPEKSSVRVEKLGHCGEKLWECLKLLCPETQGFHSLIGISPHGNLQICKTMGYFDLKSIEHEFREEMPSLISFLLVCLDGNFESGQHPLAKERGLLDGLRNVQVANALNIEAPGKDSRAYEWKSLPEWTRFHIFDHLKPTQALLESCYECVLLASADSVYCDLCDSGFALHGESYVRIMECLRSFQLACVEDSQISEHCSSVNIRLGL